MYQLNRLKSLPNLIHAFSEKKEGNMSIKWGKLTEIIKNRENFLKKSNIALKDNIVMEVVHGSEIRSVDKKFKSRTMVNNNAIKADALVTKDKNLFLFLLTADCLPIIFYEPEKEVIALAHLSRKNSSEKFAKRIIEFLRYNFKIKPINLLIGIGPGIHKESYSKENIPQEKDRAWQDFLENSSGNEILIDLIGFNLNQLSKAGIKKENIEISNIDTGKSPNFFSHRRAENTGEKEGRFATVVGMIK